ncbi:hypothetical protein FHS39_002896 [Streptomyces olivoverticillatus]|uniref:Uncharacterized protein n=1 Tax=Streptomyces olivoverticillatus TaxID=66427 RepID=A0A7W7LPH6_9ACTN|nr:hypothetical protein [Streptomyces olivoverticillatus]MBB4893862.1 hypothetical protein [Streptomyces olivoverticillatus]
MACATPGYDGPAWGPGCGAGGEEEPGGWDGGDGWEGLPPVAGWEAGWDGAGGRAGVGAVPGPPPGFAGVPGLPARPAAGEAAGAVEGDAEGVPE